MLATMRINDNQHKGLVVLEGTMMREANQDCVFLARGNNSVPQVPSNKTRSMAQHAPSAEGPTIERNIRMDNTLSFR